MGTAGIITSLVALGGWITTTFMFFRQKKQKEDIGVSEKEVDLSAKSLAVLNQSFETFMKSNEMKEKQISKLEETIAEMRRELNACKLQIIEQERKINGMQLRQTESVAVIERLKSGKAHSDGLICTNRKCPVREPKLGTYKNNESA